MNFRLTKTFDLLKLSLKIIPFEIFALNYLLKLLGNLKTRITSRLVYVLLIAQFGIVNNRFELRFDIGNNIKVKLF